MRTRKTTASMAGTARLVLGLFLACTLGSTQASDLTLAHSEKSGHWTYQVGQAEIQGHSMDVFAAGTREDPIGGGPELGFGCNALDCQLVLAYVVNGDHCDDSGVGHRVSIRVDHDTFDDIDFACRVEPVPNQSVAGVTTGFMAKSELRSELVAALKNGNEATVSVRFATGWNKDMTFSLNGASAAIEKVQGAALLGKLNWLARTTREQQGNTEKVLYSSSELEM